MDPRGKHVAWVPGFVLLLSLGWSGQARGQEIVEVGDRSANCLEDPACINRLHPAIPMVARAKPGATIVLHTKNASDFDLDPHAPPDPRAGDAGFGTVHPLTGPVHIEGAEPGDVLKVRILDIAPTELHQRTPLVIGSKDDVAAFRQFVVGERS